MVVYITDSGSNGDGTGGGYTGSGTGMYGSTGDGHDICSTICAIALPLALLASVFNLISSGFGFVTVTTGTGRRRRDVNEEFVDEKLREFSQVQEFVHESLDLGMEFNLQEDIVAKYLTCSGMMEEGNHCLEHLACSYSDPTYKHSPAEKTAISVIIHTILENHQIGDDVKDRLRRASAFGLQNPGTCLDFTCDVPALAAATSQYPLPSLSNFAITNHAAQTQPTTQSTGEELTPSPTVKTPTLAALTQEEFDIAAAIRPYAHTSGHNVHFHNDLGSRRTNFHSSKEASSLKHRGKPSARQGRIQNPE
ncbi:hypothetical protein SK128_005152 [Halocaridina rubra]|uniref:Uncharacterized protein n=1 Tax=Halocaridina rubra TaxID=373956 RepID=A0AAN9A2G8_HALRR